MRRHGYTVYPVDRLVVVRRAGRLLPLRGEKWYYVESATLRLLLRWAAYHGTRVVSVERLGADGPPITFYAPEELRTVPIKKRQPPDKEKTIPALPAESKILAKFPLLREFLSATQYEDGEARVPGYLTIRPRFIEWEVTLYDPDAGCRVAVRARTLDDMLQGAEVILSASEAPWEPDNYLQEQLAKRTKKKK